MADKIPEHVERVLPTSDGKTLVGTENTQPMWDRIAQAIPEGEDPTEFLRKLAHNMVKK